MAKIIPSVLATTEEEYRRVLKIASSLGEWVHIDIVDGQFSENETVSLSIIKKYKTKSKKEAHLMVTQPSIYLEPLIESGFKKIILPFETEENLANLIGEIKSKQCLVGLSLNPETSIKEIDSFLEKVDYVLLLSVHPGFSGQEFIPETLKKLEDLVLRLPAGVQIEVDGGVDETNAKQISDSGVDILVIGSRLVNSENPKTQLETVQRSMY